MMEAIIKSTEKSSKIVSMKIESQSFEKLFFGESKYKDKPVKILQVLYLPNEWLMVEIL